MASKLNWNGQVSDREGLTAGVDEAGRGPLAGPVIAAAVILPPKERIANLRDSKSLSAAQREAAAAIIQSRCQWAVGRAEPEEIDEMNILRASLEAMRRAVLALTVRPATVLVDGPFVPKLECRTVAVVKGDQLVRSISAASIVAKVTRDAEMQELAKLYPSYGFERNKGYPTPEHLRALQAHGPSKVHRKSFRPVRESGMSLFGESRGTS